MAIGGGSVGGIGLASRRRAVDTGPSPQVVITTGPVATDALAVMASVVITLTTNGVTTDAASTALVTASIATGVGTVLSGASVNAIAGVATFPAIRTAGATITYRFSAPGYASAVSGTVVINQLITKSDTVPTYVTASGTSYTGGTANPIYFIPATYTGANMPVMIAWHGSGANLPGFAVGSQITDGIGLTVTAHKDTWPYITIFPQFTQGSGLGNAIVYGGPPIFLARLTTDGIAWDNTRVYGYGFSEGGYLMFDELFLYPTTFAAAVIAASWVNPAAMHVLVANGMTGYNGNTDPNKSFTLAANYWLAVVPNIPLWQVQSTADTGLTGFNSPVQTIPQAFGVQNPILAQDQFYQSTLLGSSFTHNQTRDYVGTNMILPSDSIRVWLDAQQIPPPPPPPGGGSLLWFFQTQRD